VKQAKLPPKRLSGYQGIRTKDNRKSGYQGMEKLLFMILKPDFKT